MSRLQALENWVRAQFPEHPFRIEPASADASFRRYFRVFVDQTTHIVMDAPPEHEDCVPFIAISELFGAAGVNVPQVKAQDLSHGFLLLTDLGVTTYLEKLDAEGADALYRDATEALIKIQLASRPMVLPDYDEPMLRREMNLFPEWYLAKHLGITVSDSQRDVLESVFRQLLDNNLAQPRVYVHRDYHSRNLMVTEPNPGVLDFQDAVYGPITYDLVSLLKDAYIDWDEERILDWAIRYWEKARTAGLPISADFADFYRDFEWMGVQRHLKVLGIFARLYHRDGKDGYLKDMPRVMEYLRKACQRYRPLMPLFKLLDQLQGRQAAVGYTF